MDYTLVHKQETQMKNLLLGTVHLAGTGASMAISQDMPPFGSDDDAAYAAAV